MIYTRRVVVSGCSRQRAVETYIRVKGQLFDDFDLPQVMHSVPNVLCVGPNAFDGHVDTADRVEGSSDDAKGATAHDSSLIEVVPYIYSECVACDFERLNEWIHWKTEAWIGVHIQVMNALYSLFDLFNMLPFETICVSTNFAAQFLVIRLGNDTSSRAKSNLVGFSRIWEATVFPRTALLSDRFALDSG